MPIFIMALPGDNEYILWHRIIDNVEKTLSFMTAIKTFTLFFLFVPMLFAQSTEHRRITSLNGQWNAIIDPYENGYYNYRYEPSGDGYFKNRKPATKHDLIEYDFDLSETLNVPGDWNTQRSELLFYEGTIWYKRSFDYSLPAGKRLFVHFGAANYHAIVYFNGEKLGEHIGGFTPFQFEITGTVKEKGNFLIVKVDNKRHREAVPTVNTDWWNYGGLTRDVYLTETPATLIKDYSVQLQRGSNNQIYGWVQLSGDSAMKNVTVAASRAKFRQSGTTDAQGRFFFSGKGAVNRWSPETPHLYDVTITAGSDTIREQIGFRTIETKGSDILLNGVSIFLRGISIHEESPTHGGRAFSAEDARITLRRAKDLGCNFVRLAHYPHNEHMIRMADSMGLLVWSEVPVYWTITWENPATLANAKNQLSEMITRDKNRASVILWSVANETPLSEPRLRFLTSLVSHVRSLDSTRLLTAALERHYIDAATQVINDPLGKYLDVLGCNEYIGWYEDLPEKASRVSWKFEYDKPLIISEFGADAKYGFHGDSLTRWTEEYQEYLYKQQIGMLKTIAPLRGVSPWILADFRSPRRPLPKIQDFFNRKGLISNTGEKKKAYWILREYYGELQQQWKTRK
jgi:beta-glucuronidase